MSGVLAVLARFALALLGYATACLAASAFLHVLFFGWSGLADGESLPVFAPGLMVSVPVLALFIAHLAFWPAVAAIAVGEFLGKRDWLFYGLAGGAVALVFIGLFFSAPRSAAGPGDTAIFLAMIGAGIAGGLAYWLAAGQWPGPRHGGDVEEP